MTKKYGEASVREDWTRRQAHHGNQPRSVLMKGLHPKVNATLDRWHQQTLERAFADLLPTATSGVVLDVGCGYGRLAETARRIGLVPLLGMDFTSEFCRAFKKTHGPAICASLSHPPIAKESLSAFYAVTSLMYISHEQAQSAFQALDECLVPGGLAFFLEPSKEFNDLVRHVLPGKRADALAADGFTRPDFEGALVPANWRILRSGANGWMTLALPLLIATAPVQVLYRSVERVVTWLESRRPTGGRLPRFAMYRWALYRKPGPEELS